MFSDTTSKLPFSPFPTDQLPEVQDELARKVAYRVGILGDVSDDIVRDARTCLTMSSAYAARVRADFTVAVS